MSLNGVGALTDQVASEPASVPEAAQASPSVEPKQVAMQEVTSVEQTAPKFTSSKMLGLRALVQMAAQEPVTITQVFEQAKAQDFASSEPPLAEVAKIDTLLQSGVNVDEVMVIAESGSLPVLAAPQSQVQLVRMVEDQGFRAIVSQVTRKLRFF